MFRSSRFGWMKRRIPASLPLRMITNWFRPRLEALEDRTLPSIFLSGDPNWSSVGPIGINEPGRSSNYSQIGAVNQIAVNPTNPSEAFAATTSGGIWRTEDATDANPLWSPMTDGMPSLSIGAIAYSPLNNSTIFAGTGDFSSGGVFGGISGGPFSGVYESTDSGATWTQLTQGFPGIGTESLGIRQILPTTIDVPPLFTNPGQGGGQLILAGTTQGIYESSNGGATWTQVALPTGPNSFIDSLVADPLTPDLYYASVANFGVIASIPGTFGTAWVPINNNIPSNLSQNNGNVWLATAAYGTQDVLYASCNGPITNNTSTAIIFQSLNPLALERGASWNGGPQGTGVPLVLGRAADHIIAADPSVSGMIYVTNRDDVWRGNFNDGSVTNITNGSIHSDPRSMTVDPNGNLLQTDDGGIYRDIISRDSSGAPISDQVSSINGSLAITEYYHIAYDSLNNVVFGGTQDNGSPDVINGQWTDDTPGQDGGQVAVVNSGSTSIHYTSNGNLGIWNESILNGSDQLAQATISIQPTINNTGGLTLAQALFSNPAVDASSGPFAAGVDGFPFVIDAVDPQRILVGTNYLYESFDGGNTLTELGGVIPPQNGQPPVLLGPVGTGGINSPPALNGVSAMAYGGMLNGQPWSDVVYLGTNGGPSGKGLLDPSCSLFLRTAVQQGTLQDFQPLTSYPGGTPKKIVLDPNDWQIAYVLDWSGQIYETTDAGSTWTNLTSYPGLPQNTLFASIALYDNPGLPPGGGILVAGGFGGVYRLLNSGVGPFWSQYGDQAGGRLPNVWVTDLQYDATSDTLVAGTWGRGAWVVQNASLTLPIAENLQIVADAGDTIRLALDATNNTLLDVQETNSFGAITDFLIIPVSAITGITVDGTAGNVTLDVDENPGVQSGAGPIDLPFPIDPNCVLDFSGVHSDTFIVDDALDQAARNISLGTDQITGLGMTMCYIPLLFNAFVPGNLQVDVGSSLETITVDNQNPNVTTTINTGSDGNSVTIQDAAGAVIVNSSSGGSTINVQGTTQPLTINSGGPDTINVGDANGLLDIHGLVSINRVAGPLDLDILNVNDTGDTQSQTVFITGDSVSLASALIEYGAFALSQLNITGDETNGNAFNVKSTAAPFAFFGFPLASTITTINSQAADTINVGGPTGLPSIEGQLVINGILDESTLNLNDQSDPTGQTVTITNKSILSPSWAEIDYARLGFVTFNGHSGGDTLNVQSTAAPIVTGRFSVHTTTTINSSGADIINVGDQNGVQDIQGNLAISAPLPENILNINDQGDASGRTATITSTAVTGLAPATISYVLHSLSALNFTGDSSVGGNTFNVQSTTSPLLFITPFGGFLEPTITTINSKGADIIDVGDSTGVQDIRGQLIVNGSGATQLVADDELDKTGRNVTVSGNAVTGLAPAEIDYAKLDALELVGGSGGNNFTVQNTAAGTSSIIYSGTKLFSNNVRVDATTGPLTIDNQGGGQVALGDISPTQQTLAGINGAVNVIDSGPGGTTLILDDNNDTSPKTNVTMTDGLLTGLAPAPISWIAAPSGSLTGGVTELVVKGGVGDTYNIKNTSAFTTFIENASGNVTENVKGTQGLLLFQSESFEHDTVTVGSLAPTLGGTTANIKGTIEVSGNGSATLTVDDSGDTTARTVTTGQVSGNLYSITGLSQGTIEYTSGGVQSVTLDAPSIQENSMDINGTPTGTALTVHAGFGNVTVIEVPDIGGPLTVVLGEDNTTYWFDGPATDNNRVYTINSTSVTRTGGFVTNIVYPTGFASESFALFTGNPFTDTINVQSSLPHTGWFLDGAPFNPNVFNIGDPAKGLAAVQGEIHINTEAEPGSTDVETVNLNDQPDRNPQTFTFSFDPNQGLNNVSWNGGGFLAYNNSMPPLANLVVNAGSGNTTFQAKTLPATNTAITLKGGSGVNTLDYSNYVGNITVDLPLGVATGFSGGISNIENVTGSQGNDLIVGDANPNVLIGGTGRNIIIGGAGADQITGGGGDNILIGGTTAYDTNLTALDAILSVWTDPTLSIGQRSREIKKGIVVGGQTYALNKSTVFADNAPDSLIGGPSDNWFFVDSDDKINNGAGPGPNDEITHV
jgi:hypothetical protein